MDLKPSSVTKNSAIKAELLDNSKDAYDPMVEVSNNIRTSKEMTRKIRSDLVDIINKDLKKQDHEIIYTMLRKVKECSFFSSNKNKTHFNIRELNNKTKWKLYQLALMCKANTANVEKQQNAELEHNSKLESLNKKIDLKQLSDEPDSFNGLTEKEKFSRMINLQPTV